MSNIHPVYQLIQSLESSEKAYFKKFGFKKESKNNESIKRLFDLIDKQKEFSLEKLIQDKKLNEKVKAHIHVNLNYLHKRIVQSLLESRRDVDKISLILTLIAEFNLYKEKKLFSLASKTLKSINKLMINNDFFILKPYVKTLSIDLNRMEVNRDFKITKVLITDYEHQVNDFNTLVNTQLIGLKIEGLMDRNGGTLIKFEEDRTLAKELIVKTKEIISEDKKDFQLRSILANNLYILTMMVGKWQDFEEISSSLLDYYIENIEKRTVAEDMFDFLVVLINLTYFGLMLGKGSYKRSLEVLERDQYLVTESSTKKKLTLQTHALQLLQVSLHQAQEIDDSEILRFQNIFRDIPKTSYEGLSYCRQIALILFKRSKYNDVIDETAEVMQLDLKGLNSNGLNAIRLIRVMAWLKLENLNMAESELNQSYRYVLEMDKDKIIRRIINYVKRLSSFPSKEKKKLELDKIQKAYNALLEANEISEYLSLKIYMDLIHFECSL